jgi:glutathione S-transferase
MANIVFLADGTWNGPGQAGDEPQTTNVFKLFSLLAGTDAVDSLPLAKEQERELLENGQRVQIAKYLHGVGDSSNALVRALGGAFGSGVIARIVRGYTFVSRNWRPGDRIFIAGFSRGAYTARSLAGLIAAKGLLDPADCEDREKAYRIGAAVWAGYREERKESAETRSLLDGVLRLLPSFVDPSSARADKPSQALRPAEVDCVAVWDTVGALGVPLYDSGDRRVDVFQFCDCALSAKVKKGYHAVALSERRADFTPTLWEPREGITQMLFAGAHADIGGGYPMAADESGLAHLSLKWMCDALEAEGLLLQTRAADVYPATAFGPCHQPWREGIWRLARTGPRQFSAAQQLQVHDSIRARGTKGPYGVFPPGDDEMFDASNLP